MAERKNNTDSKKAIKKNKHPVKTKTYDQSKDLTPRQKAFCKYYIELGNETKAGIKAGYSEKTAHVTACNLLKNPKIQKEITRLQKPLVEADEKHIATAQEVMQFFTKMMNGEIKDQFGLDASNSDKIKAAQEIAKRTVDIENRANGTADKVVQIALDWRRE